MLVPGQTMPIERSQLYSLLVGTARATSARYPPRRRYDDSSDRTRVTTEYQRGNRTSDDCGRLA
jgi:hypothetical protein